MWKFHILLLVTSLHISRLVGQKTDFRCDYLKVPVINGWIKFHEIPSNWNEARLRCHMEGAVLASPLSEELRGTLLTMMTSSKVNGPLFTGIHTTFSRGDYASIEGIPLSKIPHVWTKGEPNNYRDSESCLVLLPDGTMADVRCEDPFPYICYKKMIPTVVNICGTIDSEYELNTKTGSCYKFHKVPRTWSRAYMTCMAEGGYLAVINSDEEATVLKEVFAKNPAASMVGNFWKDVAFVGFHDWTEHGEWRTIQGQTLREAGYDKFSLGEPNNSTTGEYCGAIYRTAYFDDLWCENRYAFICEKDPKSLSCEDGF